MFDRGINQLSDSADTFDISYLPHEILVTCEKCGEELARFYSDPEIDNTRAKIEVEVGDVVTAKRVVAWVGYTYDRDMILITDAMLRDEAAHVLLELIGAGWKVKEGDPLDAALQSLYRLARDVGITTLRRDLFHFDIRRVFEKEARWRLRRKFIKRGFPNRSLWFQDREVTVNVHKIIACNTGTYDPGRPSSGYYDDGGEWPCLYGGSYHQLLAGDLSDNTMGGLRFSYNESPAMIYPSDAELLKGEYYETNM
jgi:hypothetical protein